MIGYMKTPRAAEYLGLSKSLLEKLRRSGTGPTFHRVGSAILYKKEDLDSFATGKKAEEAK
ncbi:MAG: helix-turn-helix domain-containing protein [Sphaerochaeta sp.]|jgi:excisionase family DNA binding protein|nr:helix-turn-helix domain-containing protein [Sphaerochaeta sp.]